MLTEAELSDRIDEKANKEMENIYRSMAWAYPILKQNTREADLEKLRISEYVIGRFFERVTARGDSEGAMVVFCQLFKFDAKDIEVATLRTKEDFESDSVCDSEVAVTATFLWFQAAGENGNFDTEFKYLHYALANYLRGDKVMQRDGAQNLARLLRERGGFVGKFKNLIKTHFRNP